MTSHSTPAPPTERASDRAARAIVALINARPYSPRQDEIAAIIEQLAIERPAPPPTPSGLDEYGPDLTTLRP